MSSVVVGARIDEHLKTEADEILQARNITPSQLIRNVFEYVVRLGEVPEFIFEGSHEIAIEDDEVPILAFRESLRTGKYADFDWSSIDSEEAPANYARWMEERAKGIDSDDDCD